MERFRQFTNPTYGIILVGLVVFFTTTFNWGEDTIIYALAGSVICIVLIQTVLGAARVHVKRAFAGQHSAVDFLVAPQGYRRNRAIESPHEQARLSVARRLPNIPMSGEEESVPEGSPPPTPSTMLLPTNTGAARSPVVSSLPPMVEQHASHTLVQARREATQEVPARTLVLASTWQPDVDEILGEDITAFGIKGSGKSTFGARLLEQLGKNDLPMFVADIKGDYYALPTVLPKGVLAGGTMGQRYTQGGALPYEQIADEDSARLFGERIMEEGLQVVFLLLSYGDLDLAARCMLGVIRGILAWNDAQDAPVPAIIAIDEAQRYAPQDESMSAFSGRTAKEVRRLLVDLAQTCRSRGFTLITMAQRISELLKGMIGSIKVLMKQTQDIDIKRYEELIKAEIATGATITQFGIGQAVVIDGSGQQRKVRFYNRQSPHTSHTPKVERVTEHYRNRPTITEQRTSPVMPQQQARFPIKQSIEGQTRHLPRESQGTLWDDEEDITTTAFVFQEYATGSHHPVPPLIEVKGETRQASPRPRLSVELQQALDAYEPGISYRKLGERIGVKKDKAGELLGELIKRGYISLEEDDAAWSERSVSSSSSSSVKVEGSGRSMPIRWADRHQQTGPTTDDDDDR